jgi:hypothetical protein
MKNTIESGTVRTASGATPKELDLQLSQLRRAANAVFASQTALTTEATNTLTAIWTDISEMPFLSQMDIETTVVATDEDGTNYGCFKRKAFFMRGASGVAIQLGATQEASPVIRSAAGIDITFTIVDSTLAVNVTDGGLAILDWKCWLEARRA